MHGTSTVVRFACIALQKSITPEYQMKFLSDWSQTRRNGQRTDPLCLFRSEFVCFVVIFRVFHLKIRLRKPFRLLNDFINLLEFYWWLGVYIQSTYSYYVVVGNM